MEKIASPKVVIVGAGPAGMMLAYQLVTNGVAVRVLERHSDFEREFRGELIQPSVLDPLKRLGLLPALLERKLAVPEIERRLFLGRTRQVKVPGGSERGALISQPGFLKFLHELCSRYSHYALDLGTTAVETEREGGRVVALKTRREGAPGRVEGDVFVVCNGRNSGLRKDVGAEVEVFQAPANVLWLRFDFTEAPEALPKGVDVHMFGKGVVVVFFSTTHSRLQVAYSAPGDLGALRKDLPELRRRLLPTVSSALRPLIAAKLDEGTESQILRVTVDRLKSWHVPGLLFLGDAAHTMSPAGGQGLNLAIRDSIVAANHMIAAIQAGKPVDEGVFQTIEDERRPEIDEIQGAQIRIGRMVLLPKFVLHIAFTLLGVVLRLKKSAPASHGVTRVELGYGVPVAELPAAPESADVSGGA